ncbi:MAG TPA: hypothetical protein DCO79_09325 [Spirochaeta sp.]|nr:hypothetical protein [Spirochaeta sp.]
MVFNYSKDSEYHTQINNKIIPASTCNTTSMIMALKQAGHKPIFAPKGVQPEDYFTNFLLLHPESQTRMKYRYNEYVKDKIPAYEVHEMLEWGINYLMTEAIDTFSVMVEMETMLEQLSGGCGIVLSGLFPVRKELWGHIVSLAGFITIDGSKAPSFENISHFIVDDPRGDFRTSYVDVRGNNIIITKEEFLEIFKYTEVDTHKWAHIISPNVGNLTTDI